MTTLGETRTALYTALDTALTAATERVTATPIKPGSLERSKALVTIGAIAVGADVSEVSCDLDVQVGIGPSIEAAYETMDTVLDAVNDALPINWQLATWSIEVDQDDQVVLRATTALAGHRKPADDVSGVTWSQSGVTYSESGMTWIGNT